MYAVDKCAEKSGSETIYLRSIIYKSFSLQDKFYFVPVTKKLGTLGDGLFPLRMYGNPAEYANRPNCSGSEKPIS